MRYLFFIIILCISFSIHAQYSKSKTDSDTKYYQAFKQVIDSTYYYSWNDAASLWELSNKDSLLYDTMGVLKERFTFQVENVNLLQLEKLENEIKDHEIISTTFSSFIVDEWIPDYKTKNESFSDTSLLFDPITQQFLYDSHKEYVLNVDNEVETITEYFMDEDMNIVKNLMFEYTYSSNQKTQLISKWDTVNDEWFYRTKYITSLLENGLVDTLLVQTFDTATDLWNNEQRIIHTFLNDLKIESVLQFYDGISAWNNYSKDSIIYDDLEQKDQLIRMFWNQTEDKYEDFSKNIYKYNYLGNLIEDIFQIWDNNDWINYNKIYNYYSDIICTVAIDLTENKAITCFGANDGEILLSINGGNEPYIIEWENIGIAELTMQNIEANKYYPVTVTDANQCIVRDSILLENPDSIKIEITEIKDVSCFGMSDGKIKIVASGGTGNYSYVWNDDNESITDSIVSLLKGNYTIRVIDENDCNNTMTLNISEPSELLAFISDTINVTCFGLADGFAEITATGGTRPYDFSWPALSSNDSVVNILEANQYYQYIVNDINNCQFSDSVMVSQPDAVVTSDILGFNIVQKNDMVEYSVEATEGSFYDWTVNLGNIKYGNGTNLILVEWETAGEGEVTVLEENIDRCYGDTIRYDVTIRQETGVTNIKNSDIQVYPNPFSERLNVILTDKTIAESYQIIDLSGKVVKQQENLNKNEFVIHRSDLESGIYYLRIIADQSYMMKVVVD
jgi:Secretion system C-terminal sorting domain/SprB repeat